MNPDLQIKAKYVSRWTSELQLACYQAVQPAKYIIGIHMERFFSVRFYIGIEDNYIIKLES
jgi:hypothetical protein